MKAAFFDIDGTLLKCQTQRIFARVMREEKLLTPPQEFRILSWFFLYKLGLLYKSIDIRKKAYKILTNHPKELIDKIFFKAVEKIKQNFLRQEMINIVKQHKEQGHLIFGISASLSNLCLPICKAFQIENCYSTDLFSSNGRYTGYWKGVILEGEEKVKLMNNIASKYQFQLSASTGYADSFSDLPMLLAVGEPVAVWPDLRLETYARQKHWKIVRGKP